MFIVVFFSNQPCTKLACQFLSLSTSYSNEGAMKKKGLNRMKNLKRQVRTAFIQSLRITPTILIIIIVVYRDRRTILI